MGDPVLKSYETPAEGDGAEETMVIGFAGENDKLGGLPQKGGVKPENFLKLCKKSGVKFALVVRDPTHSWFHRGLAQGDSGGFNSVIEMLQAEIALVQPRELIIVGASMGGYAAIRAGLALHARMVLAFSPQVLLSGEERSMNVGPLPWLDPYLIKLQLAAELEGFKLQSLLEVIESTPSECNIHVQTGSLDGESMPELEMLRICALRKGNGSPRLERKKVGNGVQVSIRPHTSEDPLTMMKESGELQSILASFASAKKSITPKKKKGVNRSAVGRSALWMSKEGREDAAAKAGLTDLTGPVVKPSDGRGFDPTLDARALPGEADSQFQAMLTTWAGLDASDLPGFFFWHKPAFDLTHANLKALGSIFFEYCKKGAAPGATGKTASDSFTMSLREWIQMCKEAKIPVSTGELNDAHNRCDRASKEEKAKAKESKKGVAAKANKELCFAEFIEALLRVSIKMMATSASGKKAIKAGNGGEGYKQLMHKHILPLVEHNAMGVVRTQMEPAEVNEVLRAFSGPLEKQFLAIAKRQTKILDPSKRPKGDGLHASPPEVPLLNVEDFIKDIERQKMFVEMKELVPDPIRGNPDINVYYELSRLDAERAFIEAQDREQAILGMLTGDKQLLAASSLLDFAEYKKLVALCGLNMFRTLDRLPPHEKVECFVRTMTAAVPELDYRDYVIRDRLNHAINYAFAKGLVRFNCDKDLSTPEEKAIYEVPDWNSMWKKMDLNDVHGWPLWEKEVYLLLGAAFNELASIFAYYSKSGGVGTSAESAFVLQQAEVTNFALDCGLAAKDGPIGSWTMARIHMLMEQSDQSDAKKVMAGRFKGDELYDKRKTGGNNTLELFEFCELIVRIAFYRANPKYGSVGNREVKGGVMPKVLEDTLKNDILPKAKRDMMREILEQVKTDPEVQAHFKTYEFLPETRHKENGLKRMFEAKAYETRKGIQELGIKTISLETLIIWMGPDFQGDGGRGCSKNVLKDIMVSPTPQVTGTVVEPRHSNLSNLDVKGIYSTAQRTGNDNKADGKDGANIDYEEFLHTLALCGWVKYQEISEMTLANRVEAIIRNFLQEEDEHKVISKYCYPPLPRYNTSLAKPLEGESPADFKSFLMFWGQMDLSHVYGFPLWEEGVFNLLHENFEQLRGIFDYYAKSGTAGSSSTGALLTMQQTELQTLAIDVGLNSAKFSMTRVINIFKRADQVDDTYKATDADHRVATGKGAEAGDKGLELAEFLECVVMLAFERTNPEYGEVGSNNKAFELKADGSVRKLEQKRKYIELPGCLETFLKDVLLKKAKTDTLAKIKKVIMSDVACQAVLKEHRAYFLEEFKERAVDGNEAGSEPTWTLEIMMKDFIERTLLKDLVVTPTPAVAGTTPPSVHSNLSWLDAKGAFVTAQDRVDKEQAKKGKVNKKVEDSNTTVTFDEFYMCVALCGHIKYEEIEQMTIAQRVEGIFYNYRHAQDGEKAAGKWAKGTEHKHGRKDEHAWISECLYPPLPRYDYANSGAAPEMISTWSKMDLKHVLGFPLWEKEAFGIFAANYDQLKSIFQQYAKSGTAGSGSAAQTLNMQKTELTNLALDCELCNAQFTDAKLISLFLRADQVDDTLYRDEATGVVKGQQVSGGDRGLELPEFFELLCMIALARANPKYGSVGHSKTTNAATIVEHPMPGCLDTLLKKSILAKAKTDGLAKVLKIIAKDPEIRAVFNKVAGPLRKGFEAHSNKKASATKEPTMTLEQLVQAMNQRKVAKDVIVTPKPAVSGTYVPAVHSNLSQLDIRGAFSTAQGSGSGGSSNTSAAGVCVDYGEFCNLLGLCGYIKYEEIAGMTLAQKVEGIIDNYLQRKDEKAVISDCLYPPLPRYDYASSGADKAFLELWAKMDFTHIFGFPLWEEVAFAKLASCYKELKAVYEYYAKTGTAGASSAEMALTMQSTELGNMCLDIDVLTKDFNMTRVINLFRRADQVDDTFQESKANHFDVTGETAKGGDRGLELHEFFEFLVMLGFYRFNPDYGEQGSNYAVKLDAGQTLTMLLDKHVLKKAKKDGLVAIKAEILASAEIKALFKKYEKPLYKEWKSVGNGKGPMKVERKEVLSMEMFCEDMGQQGGGKGDNDKGSRRIVRELTVTPTPAIKGMQMPSYHSNLSQMDIKSAFMAAQREDTTKDGVNSLLTIDFHEWILCLALCGHIKYEEVEEMTLEQRVEGLFSNYIRGEDETKWGSEHDVITKAVVEPMMRFDASYSQPSGGQPRDEYEMALDVWNKMDLQHLHGFPIWEPQVFELLKTNFGELKAIFANYAGIGKSTAWGARGASTMDQTELTQFAVDCSLATANFPMTRIIELFERADVVDDAKDGKSKSGQKAGAGDGALELHEFFEALVMISFHRAQPKYAQVGNAVELPLPDCLQALLEQCVLKNAKSDELTKFRGFIEKDRKILNRLRPRRDKLRDLFEASCKLDKTVKKGLVPKMGIDRFCDDLFQKGIVGEVVAKPTPQTAGAEVPEFKCVLTMADAKTCFTTVGVGDIDGDTITFDEFVICLALCGNFKYGTVKNGGPKDEGMDVAQRAEALCFEYSGEKTVAQAITDALYPPLVRYDPAASGADAGFIENWKRVDLSTLFSFPLWEEDVFFALYGAFGELQSIFAQYAKSEKGTKSDRSAVASATALTMQQAELTDLALDCSLATADFPMERVVQVFESADAVKDPAALKKGATADGNLELHEFLEAVVKLAFHRANPEFGKKGTSKDFVKTPLPECLVTMLKDNLLLNAKRDALAETKKQLFADPKAMEAIRKNKDALKARFEKLAKADVAATASSPKKADGKSVSLERLMQELFEIGVAKEVMVQPISPVKGKTLPSVRTNLTIIDAKGAFVTAQKVEASNANNTVNSDEFVTCLALCGAFKYKEVENMSLGQKVEAIFANYLGTADELACLQPILAPPPPRFNPVVQFSVPGKAPPPKTFMATWEKMDLSHLWGFPDFEAQVFELLSASFGELSSIYSQYCKSGSAGAGSMAALTTMQQTEFMNFAMDCGIMTDQFTSMRVQNVFIRADQIDDTMKATTVKVMGIKKDAKVGEQDVRALAEGKDQRLSRVADRIQEVETTVMRGEFAQAGDKALTFVEFLEAIVSIALFRANPKLGELGHDECAYPLPGCFETLLKQNILVNAKRDALALVKSSFETNADVLAMMPEVKRKLQNKKDAKGLTQKVARAWDDVTAVGVRKVFGQQVMSMDMLQDELTKRRCSGDIFIKPHPKVKGDVFPEKHMNLSWLDVKGAFTTCQNGFTGRDSAESNEGAETIDFEEFIVLLGLIGYIKYAEIKEMTNADKFMAMVDNWCMIRDEQAVINDACVPVPPRFDYKKLTSPLKGQEPKEYERLVATWDKMSLSHIYGFPVWEDKAFALVQKYFSELVSIFSEYSKSGSAGSGSAKAAMTMQSTELTNLSLDCELATDAFPMSRINLIFMRADQVDSTLVASKSDARVKEGKGAEGGDKGLELHEFLECLMFLAFSRQNPEFGNLDLGQIGQQVEPDSPMPGCFEDVLTKNILQKARRDKLAKVRKMVDKDPEVALVKKKRYAALREQFEIVCKKDATQMSGTKDGFGNAGKKTTQGFGNEAEEDGRGSTLGMDVFCDELSDRNVSEDLKVTPTPNITGLFLPPVHCNLSWIECKGAFVTCQVGTALSDQSIDFDEFLTCLALCGTIKYEKVKGLGNLGRPPNMKVGEQDDAGDPTPAEGAECPLAVIVDGIYANFLLDKDAHAVITEWQQPQLPRWDWASSGADAKWLATYGAMDLSHVFGWPLWEKEVFELLGKHYNDLKLIFQEYSKTGSAGSATTAELFTMQKTELNNLSLDCGLATADFPQARVMNVFQRANEGDDAQRKAAAAKKNAAKTAQVVKEQEAKEYKERSKDLGKAKKGPEIIEDKGLNIAEFLECLVAMSFYRANPNYGQVGKTDAAAGGITMTLLPGCLETMLKSNVLAKAKRDQVPAWMAEIVSSKEVQKVIEVRREPMRMRWRSDAGKGEQGATMTNKMMTDGGLSMDMATFIDKLTERDIMGDKWITPQPPVVGQAVDKVHCNLSALDIKAGFAGAQDADVAQILNQAKEGKQGENLKKGTGWSGDKLQMGNANHKVNFEEWLKALALCGHIKYMEVKGSKMADRVAGILDNYLLPLPGQLPDPKSQYNGRTERQVVSEVLYPSPPRTKIAETAKRLTGQPNETHQAFLATWRVAMNACLEVDVIGFPIWEEAVFKLLQANFEELQAIFSNYAQSVTGGSLQASTKEAITLQDNELVSMCRDAGLVTEKLSNARVQSLMKDVAGAFKPEKGTGGTGVYSEGIAMPAFIVLLLLIALNRANPKLGETGFTGLAGVTVPLPDCLEQLLNNYLLKNAKKSRMMQMLTELKKADLMNKTIYNYRGAIRKEFDAACKKREKQPAVALFAKTLMSRPTLVADFKDRGVIVSTSVKAKPKVTGDAAVELELTLSALDVEGAFTLCQAPGSSNTGSANDQIDFDEFLVALGVCGLAKFAAVSTMSTAQKCEAIIAEYLGKASIHDVVMAAEPKLERYVPPSNSGAPAPFLAVWKQMDGLQYVPGFPTWEPEVFKLLAGAYLDLEPLFTYYAGDTPGMQQAELVDLALDNQMVTKAYPITKVVTLFQQVNDASGGGDADFELYEFLTFLVHLAFDRDGAKPASLETLLSGLRRSQKVVVLQPLLETARSDAAVGAALTAGKPMLDAAFGKAAAGAATVSERALLMYLEECMLIRAEILILSSGAEVNADLTWQDASAAFQVCAGGAPLNATAFSQCVAVCGLVKYGGIASMGTGDRVAGFIGNLAGTPAPL